MTQQILNALSKNGDGYLGGGCRWPILDACHFWDFRGGHNHLAFA